MSTYPTPQSHSMETAWMYWYPRVYGYFYKRVNDQYEVEELTAQTMNTVFTADNVRIFHAYLWKVAHNYLVKYIRTKSLTPMTVSMYDNIEDDQVEYSFSIDSEAEQSIASNYSSKLKALKVCIKNQIKNNDDQQLIQLCIYEEKNSTEVAELAGVKAPAIRKRLSRLLSKLRSHCRELWPDHLTADVESIT